MDFPKRIVLICLCIISIQAQQAPECIYPTPDSRTCLQFYSQMASWDSARQLCQDNGGHLVIEVNNTIREFVTDQLRSYSPSLKWWIGAYKENFASWTWTDGDTLGTYFDWIDGAPNDPISEPLFSCVRLSQSEDYAWEDMPCSASNAYICQHENNDCSTIIGVDYVLQLTTSCVSVHLNEITWFEASESCREVGGSSLVAIKDAQTQEDLISHLRGELNDIFIDLAVNGLWIALRRSHWLWIDSSPVTDYNWYITQPATSGGCVQYGSFIDSNLLRTYEWMSASCTESANFVCDTELLTTVQTSETAQQDTTTSLFVTTEPLITTDIYDTTTTIPTTNIGVTTSVSVTPTEAVATTHVDPSTSMVLTTKDVSTEGPLTTKPLTTSDTITTKRNVATTDFATTESYLTTQSEIPTAERLTTADKYTTSLHLTTESYLTTASQFTTHDIATTNNLLTTTPLDTTQPHMTSETEFTTNNQFTTHVTTKQDMTTDERVMTTTSLRTSAGLTTNQATTTQVLSSESYTPQADTTTAKPNTEQPSTESATTQQETDAVYNTTEFTLIVDNISETTTGFQYFTEDYTVTQTEDNSDSSASVIPSSTPFVLSKSRSTNNASSLPVYAVVIIVVASLCVIVILIGVILCLRQKAESITDDKMSTHASVGSDVNLPRFSELNDTSQAFLPTGTPVANGFAVRNGGPYYVTGKLNNVIGDQWHWQKTPMENDRNKNSVNSVQSVMTDNEMFNGTDRYDSVNGAAMAQALRYSVKNRADVHPDMPNNSTAHDRDVLLRNAENEPDTIQANCASEERELQPQDIEQPLYAFVVPKSMRENTSTKTSSNRQNGEIPTVVDDSRFRTSIVLQNNT